MYTSLAYIYDKLMYDVDYTKWADYIENLFKINNTKPSSILDLGCGTGNFCLEMAKRGYEMIGVDISQDMLSCAKSKAIKEGVDILLLNQNMIDFELYGTVDSVVCLMDSINYIIYKNDVKRLFKLVRNYLNPGGTFIFDINTKYKLENTLGDNVYYDISDDITYIWQNRFDKKRKICEFDLTFFVNEEGRYNKYDEVHFERAYSCEELKELINSSDMELINVFDDLKTSRPVGKSERIFFICKNMEKLL